MWGDGIPKDDATSERLPVAKIWFNLILIMSIVVAYYHAVISTRYRRMTIDERYKGELYAYLSCILKNRSCTPVVINGVGDHIHLLFGQNLQVALSCGAMRFSHLASRFFLTTIASAWICGGRARRSPGGRFPCSVG
ncbi:MAG: transposase [Muribaculaceae bacterium]|nr:transposase [Muribaculaceae bacterium]